MKWVRRISVVLITTAMLITLTGCWNYREIESLYLVSGMAIDAGTGGSKYHLTFQCIDLKGGTNASAKPRLFETDGDSIFDAARNAMKQTQYKLFFSDCKTIIVSSDLAEEGIEPLLDWINRDAEARITSELIVATTGKAKDVLQIKEGSEEITAFTIDNIVENESSFLGKSVDVAVFQACSMLEGQGISLVLPTISYLDTEKQPIITGSCAFKEDRLVGFLNDMESRYLLFIKNQIKGGLIVTTVGTAEGSITLEITESKTKCTSIISNGIPLMKIDVKTKVAYGEENAEETVLTNYGYKDVQDYAANTIISGIESLVTEVQNTYQSDIFGFGNWVYKQHPDYWKQYGDQWDQLFPQVQIEVSAEVEIENTAKANPRKEG